jgi:hypothetical protein
MEVNFGHFFGHGSNLTPKRELVNPPGAQTFGLTVADSVTPKDCAPPGMPDSGEFRPASLRSVARSTTTWHPPLIRFSAAPFRSRNSPETGPEPNASPTPFTAP